jgi:hypothetical protein
MNEEQYLNDVAEKNHQMLFLYCSIWKARLLWVHFGQFSLANLIWELCRTYGTEVLCLSWAGPLFYFSQALVQYGLYVLTRLSQQLREGRIWVLQHLHALLLTYLIAHEASLQKRNMNAAALRAIFKTGIDSLVASEHIYLEGLLSERAGFCYTKLRVHAAALFNLAGRCISIGLNGG